MTGSPTTDLARPARVLAVGAHPDDVEFGCGATLAKWAAAGSEVHLLVCTDGSKGSWDPDADTDALVATRAQEQETAAGVLGIRAVHSVGAVDGELENDPATRARVAAVIRRIRPDVLCAHDPWKRYRLHPDHRNAGFLTLDAVVAARDPHFHPGSGLVPHRPTTLLLFEAETVDHLERLGDASTDPAVAAKIAALLAHRSQWRSTMGIDGPRAEAQRAAFEARLRREVEELGRIVGAPAAEAFKRIDEV